MSKKNAGANAGTKKKGSAFRTIFIIIYIIIAVLGIFLIKPLFDLTLGNASEALGKVASFATVHFERLFNLKASLGDAAENAFYTGMIEWFMVIAVAVTMIFLFLLPIHLMKALKRDGKKHMAVRRIFLILSMILDLAIVAIGVLFVFRLHIGSFGEKLSSIYASAFGAFDGALGKNVAVRFGGAVSNYAGFWIWGTIVCVVILLLIDILSSLGKKHANEAKKPEAAKDDKNEEEAEPTKEAVSNDIGEETVLIGAVSNGPLAKNKEDEDVEIGSVEKEGPTEEELAQADKDLKALDEPMVERIVPTRHDLAILNTLEPFHTERVEKLPGMYPDTVNQNIASLEPSDEDKAAANKTVEGENGNPNILPGIDEYGADPWLDAPVEDNSTLAGLTEAPSAKDDITTIAVPEEEPTNYVEELAPVEETPVEEAPVEETPVEEVPVEETPVEEAPVEEAPVEEAPVEETPVEEVPVEETPVEEAPVEETPVEEVPVEEAVEEDDSEHQKLLDEEAAKANTPLADNEWNVGEYDPEAEAAKKAAEEEAAKKVAEEEAAKKAAEEEAAKKAAEEAAKKAAEEAAKKAAEEAAKKAAEEAAKKPVANVKQMKPLTPTHLNNGPKPNPITPVAPAKQEEAPVEEAPEEKKIAPISGPMHTINKPIDKSAIKPVEAKHVSFDLKRYQVKTYKGNLTAEEAFQKGVTKVQPTIQPTFNNSNDKEASWKQKRRKEEIRKNGYQNVSTVTDLKPVQKPTEIKADTDKAGSIRDLLKANKAAEEAKAQNEANKTVAAEEENKPAKPVTPIKPVAPVKKAEEPKAEEKPEEKPVAKPLTPIHKPTAPADRPKPTAIKPVKPVVPKK